MAVDKLVDSTQLDTDLTAVADAIRTKGGTSAQLTFPGGFVDAIDAIETGGGGWTAEGIAAGIEPNGDVVVVGTSIRDYAFAGSAITSLSAPNATSIGKSFVSGCSNLKIVKIPSITKIPDSGFNDCQRLRIIVAPLASTIQYAPFQSVGYAIRNTTPPIIDLPSVTNLPAYAFQKCSAKTYIFRQTTLVTLAHTNAFSTTPTDKTIYVPSNLLSDYQSATNWSSLTGLTFAALEGSPYENPTWWEAYDDSN